MTTASKTVTASATATATSSATITAAITSARAVELVKAMQEVKDYLAKYKAATVEYDHEDTANNVWVVHVFSTNNDNTATLNWYNVDKTSGAITKQF